MHLRFQLECHTFQTQTDVDLNSMQLFKAILEPRLSNVKLMHTTESNEIFTDDISDQYKINEQKSIQIEEFNSLQYFR